FLTPHTLVRASASVVPLSKAFHSRVPLILNTVGKALEVKKPTDRHTHTHTDTHTHTHTHARLHAHTHTHACTHTHMQTRLLLPVGPFHTLLWDYITSYTVCSAIPLT